MGGLGIEEAAELVGLRGCAAAGLRGCEAGE